MTQNYILDAQGNAVEADLLTWSDWYEKSPNRRLAFDSTPNGTDVSTVFLGLDYQFGDGPPLLWETMIFGGKHDQFQDRYSTREQALEGHASALKMALESESK